MNCVSNRFNFTKKFGKFLLVVCFVALLIPSGSLAVGEKYGNRYDTGTYQGNYNYVYSLTANTGYVQVGTSYQKSGITLTSKADIKLGVPFGPDTETVRRNYNTQVARAVYYEWKRNPSKEDMAVEILSHHIIAGGDQKQFHLSYYEGTLPQPY